MRDRFATLGDEPRLAAMTQLLGAQRKHDEAANSTLTRFEIARMRAARLLALLGRERKQPPRLDTSHVATKHVLSHVARASPVYSPPGNNIRSQEANNIRKKPEKEIYQKRNQPP